VKAQREPRKDIDRDLGACLRRVRRRQGRTQAQLADKVGTAVSTLSRVESGEVAMLARDLEVYAEALGVPVADLLPAKWGRARST
jgi:transcriptional regulator with XRE-family HTH domain